MSESKLDLRRIIFIAIASISCGFQLYLALVKPLHPMIQSPVHLILALYVVFLANPADKKSEKAWMKWFDYPIFAGITFLMYYAIAEAPRLTYRVQYVDPITTIDIIAMVISMVILLEAVRRTLGSVLFGFILFFIAYGWFGPYFPAFMRYKGTTLVKFTEAMTMGSQGIYGIPLYTSASSLFYFIMFGALFAECGGGQLLIDIGMKFSNRSSGGPAKAAVISSGLMGMVSGSAVANVSTTGVMTIPMMKKVGYEPHEAGAIEAVASTGGQIMPPIMGIGAFIMAEMLGIPYGKVALSAAIPAFAYYFSVFILVSCLAKKKAVATAEKEAIIEVKEPILVRMYMLLPAIVLVYYIVRGASLMRSGIMGIFACLLCNIASKFIKGGRYYIDLKTLGKTTLNGVKQAAEIAIPTAACGIIIGIVIQSGLATKMSRGITAMGASNLFIALLIAMIGCMLLGMALPTVAAYLVANILFVPVLIGLGIQPLVANMFVFYFGIMAQITPPVCLASYTAAGIAGADAMKTGWAGMRYALVAFLVPFVFAYDPSILLIGTPLEIVKGTFVVLFGSYLLACSIAGFMGVTLKRFERVIVFVAAICLIAPEIITDIIGFSIGTIMIIINLIRSKKMKGGAEVATTA